MKPEFIGIGMQRCATSWLQVVLSEHLMIFKPNSGLHFFNRYFDRGIAWYESELSQYVTGPGIVGEFSTTYSYPEYVPLIAERIYTHYPKIKLIVSIREPAERCYSDYLRTLRRGEINVMLFQEAIHKYPELVERSFYTPILESFLDLFSRSQLHVIVYDYIVHDPVSVVKDLYDFLEVDSEYQPTILRKKVGESYEMKSPKFEILLRQMQSRTSRLVRGFGLGQILDLIKRTGIRKWLRKANTVDVVDSERDRILQELRPRFHIDVERTMQLTGLDLSAWLADVS